MLAFSPKALTPHFRLVGRSRFCSQTKPPAYLPNADGSITFAAEVEGARTSGSNYTRCELREMRDGDEYEWKLTDKPRVLTGSVTIHEVPKKADGTDGRLIVAQIHSLSNGELMRLYFDNGKVYFNDDQAGGKGEEQSFLLQAPDGKSVTGVPLGAKLDYRVEASKSALKVSMAHQGVVYSAVDLINKAWTSTNTFYFKAGVYLGVGSPVSAAGVKGTGRGKVTHFDITLDGAVATPKPAEPNTPEQPPATAPVDVSGLWLNGKPVTIQQRLVAVFADGSTGVL